MQNLPFFIKFGTLKINDMAHSREPKKESKKQAKKSLKEKRAEKKAKRAQRDQG